MTDVEDTAKDCEQVFRDIALLRDRMQVSKGEDLMSHQSQ